MIENQNWQIIHSLDEIEPEIKKLIFASSDNPFTSQAFLLALEQSQCIGNQSGWLPYYCLYQNPLTNKSANNGQAEFGLFICYLKTHSYGEYVFDWAWADAYQRNGLNYYPKLLAGIPFSPIPCSKWLSNSTLSELEAFTIVKQLIGERVNISSSHYIFPNKQLSTQQSNDADDSPDWIEREGHQFHWFNRDRDGLLLGSFEQYLSLMMARKRKNIVKERKKIQDAGFQLQWKNGGAVTEQELSLFYQCYQSTYLKRRQTGYLNLAFFQQICSAMPEQVQILFCYREGKIIAAALYLCSDDTLYGRYWGAIEDNQILHFEACYYQGIEYCIKHKIACFNPGTQGEHKIARGFIPTKTYSYHHIELPPFHQAISDFCQQEKQHNLDYMQACQTRLPFKNE